MSAMEISYKRIAEFITLTIDMLEKDSPNIEDVTMMLRIMRHNLAYEHGEQLAAKRGKTVSHEWTPTRR